jgi:hypothetical protein
MKLFARLIGKTPPSPPTLQERISILNAGSADLILDAALHADDESLRIAAIDKLPDGDALRRLAGLSATAEGTAIASTATLERAARTRLAQLIGETARRSSPSQRCARTPAACRRRLL